MANVHNWAELVQRLQSIVAKSELVCYAPTVCKNLVDNDGLHFVLDDRSGNPKKLARGIFLIESGKSEQKVQKIEHADKESAKKHLVESLESTAGVIPKLNPRPLRDQLEGLCAHDWNALHEAHHQQHVFKFDTTARKWTNGKFVDRSKLVRDRNLVHEAAMYIYLQQLWQTKRRHTVSKIAKILYASSNQKSAYDLTKMARYIDQLEAMAQYPFVQLYAIDMDDNDMVRGMVVQKCLQTVGSFLRDTSSTAVNMTGKMSILELGHSLFDAVKTLHRCGVAHIDIKPDNLAIGCRPCTVGSTSLDAFSQYDGEWLERRRMQGPLVDDCWQVKLLDFGSAMIRHACYFSPQANLENNIFGTYNDRLTCQYGRLKVTRGFLPPENVMEGDLPSTFDAFKHDIFAIGIVVAGLMCSTSAIFNKFAHDNADYLALAQQILPLDQIYRSDALRPESNPQIKGIFEELALVAGKPTSHFAEHESLNDLCKNDTSSDSEEYLDDDEEEQNDEEEEEEEEEGEEGDEGDEEEEEEEESIEQHGLMPSPVWFGPFACQSCKNDLYADGLQTLHLKTNFFSIMYAEALEHLSVESDIYTTGQDMLKVASKSFLAMGCVEENVLSKIDCRTCIARLYTKKLWAAYTGDKDKSESDGEQEKVLSDSESETTEQSTSHSVTTQDYELLLQDPANWLSLTTEERAFDIHPVLQPLPLLQLVTSFNIVMECYGHVLLPWLCDYAASAEVLEKIRLPALTPLQKQDGAPVLSLHESVKTLVTIVKTILKLQLGQLVTFAVLQHNIPLANVWNWGVRQLLLKGAKETHLWYNFEQIVQSPDDKIEPYDATVQPPQEVEGFCWRWPNYAPTLYTLCTRGFKKALVDWKRSFFDLLQNSEERLKMLPHMSDYVTSMLCALIDRVTSATCFEVSSRTILPRIDWHPTKQQRQKLIASPLQDRNGAWDISLYMQHTATTPSDMATAEYLKTLGVVPLVEAIMTVFGGDIEATLEEKAGLDTWLLHGTDRDTVVLRKVLGTSHKDLLENGLPIVWINALKMFCQTRLLPQTDLAPALRQVLDILQLCACAEFSNAMFGLVQPHYMHTTWYRIARLMVTLVLSKDNSKLDTTRDFSKQVAAFLNVDETRVQMVSNDYTSHTFWFASVVEAAMNDVDLDDEDSSSDPLIIDDDGEPVKKKDSESQDTLQIRSMYGIYTMLASRLKVLVLSHGMPPCATACFLQSAPGIVNSLVNRLTDCTEWLKTILILGCTESLRPEMLVIGSAIVGPKHWQTPKKLPEEIANLIVTDLTKHTHGFVDEFCAILTAGADVDKIKQILKDKPDTPNLNLLAKKLDNIKHDIEFLMERLHLQIPLSSNL